VLVGRADGRITLPAESYPYKRAHQVWQNLHKKYKAEAGAGAGVGERSG
jgi:hypothetical protein